jgi:signal transduction histidine kinase
MDYQIKNVPRLDSGKSLCFYRVLQEALQNVAKHSRAMRVVVELFGRDNQLTLKVHDNGIGFDIDKVRFESGLGLVSIRERLNLVGGRYTLTSRAGRGTTLTASVSISSAAK